MNLIDWSPEFELGEETMDATHREFVDLLNAVGEAPDEELLPRLDAFLEHTEAHFGDENRRMAEVNFPPSHCHTNEHENVLLIIRDVRGRVEGGDFEVGRVLAAAVADWFRQHAATMDTMLASYLRTGGEVGGCSHGDACGHDHAAEAEQGELTADERG